MIDHTTTDVLVAMVDRGEPRVGVAQRTPLAELATVHTQASAGTLTGKVVILAASTED